MRFSSRELRSDEPGGGVPAATLTYDPLMRLYQDQSNTSGAATQFVYDGTDMIAEYDQSNVLQKRTVFGAGQPAPAEAGEPLVQLDAAGNRTWLSADERGSIIAQSDDSGDVSAKNAYDEYGKPQPGNLGRFQYTGQAWIDDLGTSPASGQGLYYYKSRMYAPHLGRFMQPDPIGYAGDGLNLYAYVLNDPVNFIDWSGLSSDPKDCADDPSACSVNPAPGEQPPIIVVGHYVVRVTIASAQNIVNTTVYLRDLDSYVKALPGYTIRFKDYLGKRVVHLALEKVGINTPSPTAPTAPTLPKYQNLTLDDRYNQVNQYFVEQTTKRITEAARTRQEFAMHLTEFFHYFFPRH